MKRHRILIIDDEQNILESLEMFLCERGYEVACASSGLEGIEKNKAFIPDVIILDVRLPDIDGLELLKQLRENNHDKNIIIITAFHDMDTTIKAIKLGACEYIPKPIDIEELETAICRVLKSCTYTEKRTSSPSDISVSYEKGKIIGKSGVMKEIFKSIGMLSENRITVLIEGETGTGKELIARAIHYHSPYKNYPFLAINCSAIVGTLLESELFGHEKGAFTNAIFTKKGKFEIAGEGTIFLDEVSEIPFELQAKLLRFLQEKEFERVGGIKTLKSNARVIAATNKNLWKMVEQGIFREDLYYRLSVANIKVPALRERKSDIPLLTEYLLKKINCELHKNIVRVEERGMKRIMEYDWPGNIRELENILTRAAINTQGDVILDDTISSMLNAKEAISRSIDEGDEILNLHELERRHILHILNRTHWHLGKACSLLGLSRPTLRKKLKIYNLSTGMVK
ncbi:MAG: sigma-54 dependent transcriptional regulator [Syntrophorhabdaceae bacterium]|nr:sigma-54 dependent transcriptional regulator [Syntrophorhabdaceae bacterium]